MSTYGKMVFECDRDGCHAEHVVIVNGDFNIQRDGLDITVSASGWRADDDGMVCPQCADENPREKGDDDGREYGHPGDRLAGRE